MPTGPVDLVAGALQALAPLPVQRRAFQLEILGQLHAGLNGGGRQRLDDQTADQAVQSAPAQRLAARLAVGDVAAIALVT